MKLSKLWTILLSTIPFLQCKTIEYTPDTYQGSTLTWGSGGGITGQVLCTTLLDNGYYFSGEGLTDISFEKKGRLSQETSDQLFKNYEVLGLTRISVNNPGNTYRFLEFSEGGISHRIVWSTANDLPNSDANTMYNILKSRIEKDQE